MLSFRHFPLLFCCLLLVVACFSCRVEKTQVASIPYTLLREVPHNDEAYTQGLVIANGKVYESTGRTNSWIAEVDLETGMHTKKVVLDKPYFGEGIAILNGKVYQLTWQNKRGFVYDLASFTQVDEFAYPFEGWGITTDGRHLLISDGTDTIHYLDTLTMSVVKTLSVKERQAKVSNLNELEWIEGYLYANQWKSNYIFKIDPRNGQVLGKLDFDSLATHIEKEYSKAGVLNGIAYNPITKEILVTGKYWPKAYLIKLE
jgi:glutaminyl-peptide cyclotransferase